MSENIVQKGKLLVINYNYVGGFNSQYTKRAIVRAKQDFDPREEKNKARLNGKRFIDHLVAQKIVRFENYLEMGLDGAGDCKVGKRTDK